MKFVKNKSIKRKSIKRKSIKRKIYGGRISHIIINITGCVNQQNVLYNVNTTFQDLINLFPTCHLYYNGQLISTFLPLNRTIFEVLPKVWISGFTTYNITSTNLTPEEEAEYNRELEDSISEIPPIPQLRRTPKQPNLDLVIE
jgi:hypothetical protein